jgi:peptide/nickel transport system substrate-binding protein
MRHMRAMRVFGATAAVLGVTVLAGCGSTSSGSSKLNAAQALRIPFSADMGDPDPATFYAVEGLLVTTNVYEGLLRFKPNTAGVAADLATSWTVSPDGKTYTFKLRPNVKFHDGTTMNSTAVKVSFERMKKINGGPAYMLADVASMQTPTPLTFVVKLTQPVSAFPYYLAAPYGPKIMSPTVLRLHAGKNLAQTWLNTHDAGSGPYEITAWHVGQQYTLTAFPDYWGGKPAFRTVEIPIVSDFSSQQLQFESGDLQMLLSNVPKASAQSLASSANVTNYPTDQKAVFLINSHKAPFQSAAVRRAVLGAINRTQLVSDVFGSGATASDSFFPAHTFPTGLAPDNPAPGGSLKGIKTPVVMEYPTEGGAVTARLAEQLQVDLQQAGLNVTLRATPFAQLFTLASHPSRRPGLLTLLAPPDTTHPDAWIRLLAYSSSPVNYLGCTAPGVDQEINAGLAATNPGISDRDYAAAAAGIVKQACYLGLADIDDTIVSSKGITGIVHDLGIPGSIRLGDLRPSP